MKTKDLLFTAMAVILTILAIMCCIGGIFFNRYSFILAAMFLMMALFCWTSRDDK